MIPSHTVKIGVIVGLVLGLLIMTSVAGIPLTQQLKKTDKVNVDKKGVQESQEHDMGPRLDWYENFNNYTEGIPLPDQSTWEAWDNNSGAGDFYVSSDYYHSPPFSMAIDDTDDAVHQFSGYNSGYWEFCAWQYITNEAIDGSTYFILMNTYEPSGSQSWSTQIEFKNYDEVVESEYEGKVLPLIKGEWVEIRIIINFDEDYQKIYYNNNLLSQKSWTDGVSGDGELNIAAVDLFGNEVEYEVYYDDISLVELPAVGACCYDNAHCEDNISEEECTSEGGNYLGHGSTCYEEWWCTSIGHCDFKITAPRDLQGDTCGEGSTCITRPSKDQMFDVKIPFDAEWSFSVYNVFWDSWLYLGTDCCEGDIAINDDYSEYGVGSKITVRLEADTYYLLIEAEEEDECGTYILDISYRLFADVTGPDGEPDGVVNTYDLLAVLAAWGQTGEPGWIYEDVNADGIVDTADLLELLGSWSL